MNISTMRFLDRYLGVPACAALTLARWSGKLFRHQHDEPVKRIVIVKLVEQGSTVLAAGAIRRAIEMVGRENVFFLCFEENRFVLDAMQIIPEKNVITIPTDSLFGVAVGTLSAMRRLRREAVDAAADFEFFARSSAVVTYLTGAKRRAGFHRWRGEGVFRGDLMTHRLRYNPHMHVSKTFRCEIEALIAPQALFPTFDLRLDDIDELPPPFQPQPGEVDEVRNLLRTTTGGQDPSPLILLNPNCSDMLPLRAWPIDRYVELARRLLARNPHAWIGITGAPDEQEQAQKIVDRIADRRCICLAGKTTLRQLLVIYGIADVLVTNDSGPAHFATLTNINIVTLFGPEHPSLFASHSPRNEVLFASIACSPCVSALNDRTSACTDNRCMQAISVEAVEGAVHRALDDRIRQDEPRPVTLEVLPRPSVVRTP
jgi:ADP-heptose:LPS heptosyltransferase